MRREEIKQMSHLIPVALNSTSLNIYHTVIFNFLGCGYSWRGDHASQLLFTFGPC